jgi:hypothetical protein
MVIRSSPALVCSNYFKLFFPSKSDRLLEAGGARLTGACEMQNTTTIMAASPYRNKRSEILPRITLPASDSAPLTDDLQNQRSRGVRCGGIVRLKGNHWC